MSLEVFDQLVYKSIEAVSDNKIVVMPINLTGEQQDGAHWACAVIKNNKLFYYNSQGVKITNDLKQFFENLGMTVKDLSNDVRQQYDAENCGAWIIKAAEDIAAKVANGIQNIKLEPMTTTESDRMGETLRVEQAGKLRVLLEQKEERKKLLTTQQQQSTSVYHGIHYFSAASLVSNSSPMSTVTLLPAGIFNKTRSSAYYSRHFSSTSKFKRSSIH